MLGIVEDKDSKIQHIRYVKAEYPLHIVNGHRFDIERVRVFQSEYVMPV